MFSEYILHFSLIYRNKTTRRATMFHHKISGNIRIVLTTWRRDLPFGHAFVLLKSLLVRVCPLNLQEITK